MWERGWKWRRRLVFVVVQHGDGIQSLSSWMIGHSIPGGGYNFLLPSTTSNKTVDPVYVEMMLKRIIYCLYGRYI